MLIHVKPGADAEKLQKIVNNAAEGDSINVSVANQFDLLRQLVIRHKLANVRLSLLDEDGYVVKQINTKLRKQDSDDLDAYDQLPSEQGFNDRQLSVIRALERVIAHCEKEGVRLVGYSDELVAIPASDSPGSVNATEVAVDLETGSVYIGSDRLSADI